MKNDTKCSNNIPRICLMKLLHIKQILQRGGSLHGTMLSKCLLCQRRDTLFYVSSILESPLNNPVKLTLKNTRGYVCLRNKTLNYNYCLHCKRYMVVSQKTSLCHECCKRSNLKYLRVKKKLPEVVLCNVGVFEILTELQDVFKMQDSVKNVDEIKYLTDYISIDKELNILDITQRETIIDKIDNEIVNLLKVTLLRLD